MSSFMLAVPVVYEKYDKLNRLARAMKEIRVAFILTGASTGIALLIACVQLSAVLVLNTDLVEVVSS
jgi:hypothetical protein